MLRFHKYCPKCGKSISKTAIICEHCGYDYTTETIGFGLFSTTLVLGYQGGSGILFVISVIALPFTIASLRIDSIILNLLGIFFSGGSYFLAGKIISIVEFLQLKYPNETKQAKSNKEAVNSIELTNKCPHCGAELNTKTGDGIIQSEEQPWKLFCASCEKELPEETLDI